jgi:hypothetical protein
MSPPVLADGWIPAFAGMTDLKLVKMMNYVGALP